MEFAKVNVEVRQQLRKGGCHKIRAAGRVPGVLYGGKAAAMPVSFDPSALLKAMDKAKRRNTVFSLTVSGDSKEGDVTAMICDAQIHPVSQKIMHVDFLRIDPEQEVHVTVPLALIGKAIGVIDGGQLHQSVHDLAIAAKPAAIPAKIELDVSALKIGDALHVSDLKLGPGMRALLAAKTALASVVAPRAEKTDAEATAEAAAAAPVEGAVAAPAAGAEAKPGDKAPAAPAKKEGGEKKGK